MSPKPAADREMKKACAELLVLALLEVQPRHGYEVCKLIASRSDETITFQPASLYPVLARLEKRALIEGRWVEKAAPRRRRYYRLTAEGRRVLASQRRVWREFMSAVTRVAGLGHA